METLPAETRLQRPGLPEHRLHSEAPRQNNLVRMALRWWWVTPCCLAAALVMAKLYIHKTKPTYQSNSRIYVQQNRPRILEDNPFAVQQSATYLTNESELIQSTPVLALVVDELPPNVKKMAHPVDYVKGGLSVGVSKNDDIMTVMFESTDPVEAAEVANAVVRGYVTYQANQLNYMVTDTQRILEKEKDQSSAEVSDKLKALSQFKRDNSNLANETQKSGVINKSLNDLADKLTKAQVDEVEADQNYQAALAVADDPEKIKNFVIGLRLSGALPPNKEADDALQTLQQLTQQRTEMASHYGPNSTVMQNINDQINSIQPEKIEQDANLRAFKVYFSSCPSVLQAKRLAVQRLKDRYDEQQKEASKIAMELADYQRTETDLEADLTRAERLDEQADNRVKEISIGQDIGQVKVQVLEAATPNLDPVRPQKMMVLGIAVGMGLALGFSGMVVCDWMDTRVRSPEQVLADLTVPVLGTVPHINGGKSVINAGRQVLLDPMSEVAEGYRSIRTALYYGMHDGHARTILVTSPIAGEGKTTLVSNLAISMALAGRRTLILDADFRKPTQHVVFGLSGDVGLSSVLSGQATIANAIHRTSVDRLDVLPCGPVPMNPSESLNSHGFQQLLGELSDEYDCVLLDSAPIVPVTDAQILAAICDLTLLVLRAERSTRKTSIHARNRLFSVGAEIAGIVLNDVSSWGGDPYSAYSYRSRRPQNGVVAEITAEPVIGRSPEPRLATQMTLATPVGKPKIKRAN